MRPRVYLLILSSLVVACSSFSGTDNVAGVDAGGGDVDGGGGIVDGGVVDGGKAADAGGGPKNPGTGWCAAEALKHGFCADFDDAVPLTTIFTINDSSNTNGVTIDSTMGNTQPGSLRFVVPMGAMRLFADLKFPSSPVGFTCEFDAELDSNPAFVGSLVYIELGGIAINVADTLTVGSNPNSASYSIPGKTWTRVGVTVNASTKTVVVTSGGVMQAKQDLALMSALSTVTIHFGPQYPSEPFTMRYDNITCDKL